MDAPVRATINDLRRHAGRSVEIRGWLYNRRSSGKVQFLLVRDGTGIVQAIVVKADVPPETFEAAGRLPQESSIIITGHVREDARAPGGVEVAVASLEVVQEAEPYPITPKEHGVEFLMDHRHLWLRSSRQHAILKVRAEVIRAMTDYLDGQGYLRIDTPILTPAAVEGTTTLFATQYFDLGRAYRGTGANAARVRRLLGVDGTGARSAETVDSDQAAQVVSRSLPKVSGMTAAGRYSDSYCLIIRHQTLDSPDHSCGHARGDIVRGRLRLGPRTPSSPAG